VCLAYKQHTTIADTIKITITKALPELTDLNGVLAEFQRSTGVAAKNIIHKVCIVIRIDIMIAPLSCVGLELTFDIVVIVHAQPDMVISGYQLSRIANTDTFPISVLSTCLLTLNQLFFP